MRKVFYLLVITCTTVLCNGPKVPSQLNFGGMKLNITSSGQRVIQKHVDALHRSTRHHEIAANRAKLYFPIIERIFAEERVPDAIKYLAIQESALTSDAVSSANAVGYWQFKDFTAREMGLRVDRKIDERKNIVSSTYAAAKYLKQNNFYFKNWIYAVMAYNTGRGGAKKYLKESNIGTNRMTIDKNTHWYVLKFLAHYIAFRETTNGPHPEGLKLAEYTQGQNQRLEKIASQFNIAEESVLQYNKWVNGRIPDDKTYTVILPVKGKIPKGLVAYSRPDRGRIKEPVTKSYPDELVEGISKRKESTVISLNKTPAILATENDDVHTLSARAGLSEKRFRKFNDMSESDALKPGEFYFTKKKRGRSNIDFHVVLQGQTLWEVSQQYGIRLKKLARKNRIEENHDVKPGRVLWLRKRRPKNEEPQFVKLKEARTGQKPTKQDRDETLNTPKYAPASNQKEKVKIHTVAKGETLWAIAQLYDVKVDDLKRWNNLENPNDINEGQNLQVKAPIEERSSDKKIVIYTVQKGDNLYRISRRFGMSVDDVMELNEMKSTVISIGQQLKVYDP